MAQAATWIGMGPSPMRPVYQDAAAALLSCKRLPHNLQRDGRRIPMPSLDSVRAVATEPRLPSNHLLRRRWDRPRSTSPNTQHNPVHDYRWQPEQGIVFARPSASRRGYATRGDPLASTSPQSQPSPSRVRSSRLDSSPRAMSFRDKPVGDLKDKDVEIARLNVELEAAKEQNERARHGDRVSKRH